MATEVLWWIFAVGIVGASVGVVASRSVIHAAICLIGSLAGVGVLYIFLMVEFLALVQFLIYGGAVTVLILLALMLTRGGGTTTDGESMFGAQWPFGVVVAGGIGAILFGVSVATAWPGDDGGGPQNIGIELISERLFVDWGPPFIIASVLLLVALVGAIILARQEEGD
ncbi:MAG: NADH-quinone oxidoreductase subunit J [Dehalococcoidia bacterium]